MTLPSPTEAGPDPAAPSAGPMPSGLLHINPATGLSTDYLNHFTEAVMVLDMLRTVPECLADLQAWRPKTYVQHFTGSRFSDREAVVASYETADPAVRAALDSTAETLNNLLSEARALLLSRRAHPETATVSTQRTIAMLKPLIARMAAIINGTEADQAGPQAAVDALLIR
jgi:hypothetical protein